MTEPTGTLGSEATISAGAPAGAPEQAEAPSEAAASEGHLRLTLPGDWVSIDTALVKRWKERAGEVRPELRGPLAVLENAAEMFAAERVISAAFLAERGSLEALGTMACFYVGLPPLPDGIDLAGHVRANPPADAVEDTFEVDVDEAAGGNLRATCLRKMVLEMPARDSVSLAVEYFLPIPGEAGMLVVAFSTPQVVKRDEYLSLFSSIAASIRID